MYPDNRLNESKSGIGAANQIKRVSIETAVTSLSELIGECTGKFEKLTAELDPILIPNNEESPIKAAGIAEQRDYNPESLMYNRLCDLNRMLRNLSRSITNVSQRVNL